MPHTARPLTPDDRWQITETIHRYAWALDTGDADGFAACFAADGELLWDAFDVPYSWRGTAELQKFAAHLRDMPTTAGRQHHVSNILIEPDGKDGARSRSYVAVVVRQGDAPFPTTVLGWYEDQFRRTDAGWRIAQRIIRDWSGPVLAGLAGQTGVREAREMPHVLAGLGGRRVA